MQYDEIHEKLAIIEKSEERYKLTLDSTYDAMWEIDLVTKMFSSSKRFNDVTGYDKAEATYIERYTETCFRGR